MDRIALLQNEIQAYAWGSRTAIPELLGLPSPSDGPAAELWMGAHPKAPSLVRVDGVWVPLNEVIRREPISVLGATVAEEFSDALPFLFKVLAADQPLSIQVHPNLEQAREGFERENHLGIPLNAAERNYRDANHKPEFLCAMTSFDALKGFRPPHEMLAFLKQVCGEMLADECERLREAPDSSGLRQFLASLLSMDRARKEQIIETAVRHAGQYARQDRLFGWMIELNRAYPGDIGVLSPLVFNLITLEPGEGIYIGAGELHGYLRGVGMELMANSDNVLRGGLTPKHVDIPELLKIVDFTPASVQTIRPTPGAPGEGVYETPAKEFQLSVIRASDGMPFESQGERNVEILICTRGRARISGRDRTHSEVVKKGASVLIPAAVGPYQIRGEAVLYRASVGV